MIYKASKKITIVMVDDEPGLKDVFVFFMEQAKKNSKAEVEFHFFGNGRACDDFFDSRDLSSRETVFVISDINMPERDGITFVKELVSRHPYINTIFCTAYHCDAFRKVCAELGAFAFFAKPMNYSVLIQKIMDSDESPALVA